MGVRGIRVPGINFQGGGVGESPNNALDRLALRESELGSYDGINEISDTFLNGSKGTKTNTDVNDSALVLTTNSGSYERSKLTTVRCSSANGVMTLKAQHLAPNSTPISGNVIELEGDVTDLIDTGSTIMIFALATSDLLTVGQFLLDDPASLTATPAVLTVASASFGSGVTTVTVTNPDSLDLDMGITPASYPDSLRVVLVPATLKVKSKNSASYESADVVDAYLLQRVSIAGESYYTDLSSLGITGSIHKIFGDRSLDRTKLIGTVLEETAGNSLYHYIYSNNGGTSWAKYGTTKSANANKTEELGGDYHFLHEGLIRIADNGKWVGVYHFVNGSAVESLGGVYGDITGSPTINDTPTTASGSFGSTFGAGIIFSSTSEIAAANMDADRIDMSWAMIGIRRISGGSNYLRGMAFSNGGATFLGNSSTDIATLTNYRTPVPVFVTGTSGSHRAVFHASENTPNFNYYALDEGSFTVAFSGTIVAGKNCIPYGYSALNNRAVSLIYNITDQTVGYVDGTVNGTPSFASGYKLLINANADHYVGLTTANHAIAANRQIRSSVIQLPADEKRVQFTIGTNNFAATNLWQARWIEVPDVTSFTGTIITQNSTNQFTNYRDSATRTFQGQIVSLAGQSLRCVRLSIRQGGTFPAVVDDNDYSLWVEMQETSGGLPTGVIVGTSDSLNPAKIPFSSEHDCYFNFPTAQALTGTYALILKSDFPISATRYLQIATSSANPYGSGDVVTYNGTTWSTITGTDFWMWFHGHWIESVGKGHDGSVSNGASRHHDSEVGMQFISDTSVQLTWRTLIWKNNTVATAPLTGHTWRRVISLSNTANRSTISAMPTVAMGFSSTQYDEGMIFNVAPGADASKRRNLVTGVRDPDFMAEDRSMYAAKVANYNNVNSADIEVDTDFETGFALNINGTDEWIRFSLSTPENVQLGLDGVGFCIDIEAKPAVTGVSNNVLFGFQEGVANGYRLMYNATGYLRFEMYNASATVVFVQADDGIEAAGVYRRYRVVRTPFALTPVTRLYRATSKTGAFTEVASYSTQTDTGGRPGYAGSPIIGGSDSGPSVINQFNGKIGIARVKTLQAGVTGSPVFNFSAEINGASFVDHAPRTWAFNYGAGALVEHKGGYNSDAIGDQFDSLYQLDVEPNEVAVVDSNDIALVLSRAILGDKSNELGVRVEMARISSRDIGAVDNFSVTFS